MSIITNRHDVLFLFDVVNGNPNGDPDAGNLPRIDPTTNKGLVSDVCLKRKIRNFVIEFPSNTENIGNSEESNRFNILVKQGNIINNELDTAIKQSTERLPKDKNKDKDKAEAAMKWLCREFYDIRTFGGVLSTGEDVLKGSAYGQVRGPVQFTFGQSVHAITPLEISVTRCAVTKPEDEKKERTMGNKHIVPYALYVGKVFISPAFAEKTGFTEEDLNVFFEALSHMFDQDQSAARPEMNVRGIFDFEHVGTQADKNAEQNKREARLGCCHAYKLFDGVKIDLSEDAKKKGKTYPESFGDYVIKSEWSDTTLPKGVKLHLRHEGKTIPANDRK
ncbi:MAG: type I-C CRISPR-associated protein Cas7/Csd2 [Planctomycetes bacterium]|uniref:type I-C CRISPR-associated protein Cas7/Csd2 n=1 Tax=Candidatus Wunengus sp. YC65 TaxID=3367701 RepID=UPI001D472939|nr:type I-C CRISPR-associated protein Cas7/Csd2 [Planctomycetota bacterium]